MKTYTTEEITNLKSAIKDPNKEVYCMQREIVRSDIKTPEALLSAISKGADITVKSKCERPGQDIFKLAPWDWNYFAFDDDGKCYFYKERPEKVEETGCWDILSIEDEDWKIMGYCSDFSFNPEDWKDSLLERDWSYVDRQAQWMEQNDIKPGSKVRVLRAAKVQEQGWDNAWILAMNEQVGKTLTFKYPHVTDPNFGVKLEEVTQDYPFFVLEPVKEEPMPTFEDMLKVAQEIYPVGSKVRATKSDWIGQHRWVEGDIHEVSEVRICTMHHRIEVRTPKAQIYIEDVEPYTYEEELQDNTEEMLKAARELFPEGCKVKSTRTGKTYEVTSVSWNDWLMELRVWTTKGVWVRIEACERFSEEDELNEILEEAKKRFPVGSKVKNKVGLRTYTVSALTPVDRQETIEVSYQEGGFDWIENVVPIKGTLVPFNLSLEEDRKTLRGAWVKSKKTGAEVHINGIHPEAQAVYILGATYSEEGLFKTFTFLDDSPCGKKVYAEDV